MRHWHYKYTGRGYLRFPELTVLVPFADGSLSVRIARGGPSRVDVSIEGEGEAPNPEVIDEVVRRVHGHVVVFCQTPIQDFSLSSAEKASSAASPLEAFVFFGNRDTGPFPMSVLPVRISGDRATLADRVA